jgi:hypothetical protein
LKALCSSFAKLLFQKKLFTKALFAYFYIRKVMKKVNSVKITGISELRDLKLGFLYYILLG